MFYPKIRELRILHDYKQEFVAQKLGMSQPEYSRLENGHRKARIEDFRKLGALYEVSLNALMYREHDGLAMYNLLPESDQSRRAGIHMSPIQGLVLQQEQFLDHILKNQERTESFLQQLITALGSTQKTKALRAGPAGAGRGRG